MPIQTRQREVKADMNVTLIGKRAAIEVKWCYLMITPKRLGQTVIKNWKEVSPPVNLSTLWKTLLPQSYSRLLVREDYCRAVPRVATVVNRTRPESGEIRATWTKDHGILLTYADGKTETWDIGGGAIVLEQFDEGLAIRGNGMRLWAVDPDSEASIRAWFEESKEVKSTDPSPLSDQFVSDKDVQRLAGLLASGAINLDEFLTLIKVQGVSDSAAAWVEKTEDPTERDFQAELREIVRFTWAERFTKIPEDLSDEQALLLAHLPSHLEKKDIWRLVSDDQGEFFRFTNTPNGLFKAYRNFAPHLTGIVTPQPSINPMKLAKQIEKATSQERKFLKMLEQELSTRAFSTNTKYVIERTTQLFRIRQSRLKAFAERVGWQDLPFV